MSLAVDAVSINGRSGELDSPVATDGLCALKDLFLGTCPYTTRRSLKSGRLLLFIGYMLTLRFCEWDFYKSCMPLLACRTLSPMKKFTKAAAAKALQVSRQTVYNFIKRGLLKVDDDGLIAQNEVDNLFDAFAFADPEYFGISAQKRPLDVKLTPSLLRSIEKRNRNLKDRYIGNLERQHGIQERYIYSLELEVKKLRHLLVESEVSIANSDLDVVSKMALLEQELARLREENRSLRDPEEQKKRKELDEQRALLIEMTLDQPIAVCSTCGYRVSVATIQEHAPLPTCACGTPMMWEQTYFAGIPPTPSPRKRSRASATLRPDPTLEAPAAKSDSEAVPSTSSK